MKIKGYIISAVIIGMMRSSSAFAAVGDTRTIRINNTSYTLNVCDANDVNAVRIKVVLSLKGQPYIIKKRYYIQLILLKAAWEKSCTNTSVNTVQTVIPPKNYYTGSFIKVSNPQFITTLGVTQKDKAEERAMLYIQSVEGIIDSMIAQGIMNNIDKTRMNGKIVLHYVDDCKKIDGETLVKQWYDGNKKRIRNDLEVINLNVSICNESNFNSLFANSYKHVFIHEVGHYVYYLKDFNTESFEDICRNTNETRKSACLSYDTFYSKYAMNAPSEDYAETFAYWYQSKKPEFDLKGEHINLYTLKVKAQHFTDLFAK